MSDEDLITSNLIDAHADLPSVSPRDKLSYVDDKKGWKEQQQYEENFRLLNVLMTEMESFILINKPKDILSYLINDFFGGKNEKKLREIFREVKEQQRMRKLHS
jgi:hypothetical protein